METLEDTATQTERTVRWTPLHCYDECDGVVTISLQTRGKAETFRYKVKELGTQFRGVRQFKVSKIGGGEEVRLVTIGDNATCNCEAGRHGKRCKHADAMRKLCEKGMIRKGNELAKRWERLVRFRG